VAVTTLSDRVTSAGPVGQLLAEPAERFRRSGFDTEVIRRWAIEDLSERDVRLIANTVVEFDHDVLLAFQDYFRAGVDASLQAGEAR
jgi:hypothetical protein